MLICNKLLNIKLFIKTVLIFPYCLGQERKILLSSPGHPYSCKDRLSIISI